MKLFQLFKGCFISSKIFVYSKLNCNFNLKIQNFKLQIIKIIKEFLRKKKNKQKNLSYCDDY